MGRGWLIHGIMIARGTILTAGSSCLLRAGNGTTAILLSTIHSSALGTGTAGECPMLDNCSVNRTQISTLVFRGCCVHRRVNCLPMFTVLIRVCLPLPLQMFMIPQYKACLLCLAQQELSHLSVIFVPCYRVRGSDAKRNHSWLMEFPLWVVLAGGNSGRLEILTFSQSHRPSAGPLLEMDSQIAIRLPGLHLKAHL